MDAQALRSGKTHRDENFPVAALVSAELRDVILAFYNFVRTADDVADHAELSSDQKLAALDALEDSLIGRSTSEPVGTALRERLAGRGLSDRHARDLLKAFRQDATKLRYASWEELIDYCRLSAMPVGRFVLDVHGESTSTWEASDPLCAALQVINHLQDCGKDRRELDRVYLPLESLERHGATVEELDNRMSSPALRACLADLAARTQQLVRAGEGLRAMTKSFRLGVECGVIHEVAERLTRLLLVRDPLCETVHFGKFDFLRFAAIGATKSVGARLSRRQIESSRT